MIELSSDSEGEEGEEKGGSNSTAALTDDHNSSSGWLTTRGRASVSIQDNLQRFAFKKKDRGRGEKDRERGQRDNRRGRDGEREVKDGSGSTSSRSVCENECITVSSGSSQSDSSQGIVCEAEDITSSQEVLEDGSSSTDSSCVVVIHSPTAESAVSAPRGRGRDRGRCKRARSPPAESALSGYKLRRHKEKLQDLEDVEEELESSSDSSGSDSEEYTDSKKQSVLEFLNKRDQEELCDIPGCSLSKAKLLTQLRPFQDWSQLVSKAEYSCPIYFLLGNMYVCLFVCLCFQIETLSSRRNLSEKVRVWPPQSSLTCLTCFRVDHRWVHVPAGGEEGDRESPYQVPGCLGVDPRAPLPADCLVCCGRWRGGE